MICIVPCCGESRRFLGIKKQFLTHPLGLPLPIFSVSGLRGVTQFVFVFKEDEFLDRFGGTENFYRQVRKALGVDAVLSFMDYQSGSQVETVSYAIDDLGLKDSPIYVKDCDNFFEADAEPNSVATVQVGDLVTAYDNKSFSRGNPITEIKERAAISNYVNVGGYGFSSGGVFVNNSKDCTTISEVIANAIANGETFKQTPAKFYIDYGTLQDWVEYLKKFEQDA